VRGDVWQAYVEINGRVVYRLTISCQNKIPTELVALDNTGGGTGGTAVPPAGTGQTGLPAGGLCGLPPTRLSDSQLAACMQAWADELAHRHPLTPAPPA